MSRQLSRYKAFSAIPPSLIRALVVAKVGRNGWPVMVAYCMRAYPDGSFCALPAESIRKMTGLTQLQVARGMAELRDKGIIVPVVKMERDGSMRVDRSNHGHVARYRFTRRIWESVRQDLKQD